MVTQLSPYTQATPAIVPVVVEEVQETVWIGTSGTQDKVTVYKRVGNCVQAQYTFQGRLFSENVGDYEKWVAVVSKADLQTLRFRGAPDGPINPWTNAEHAEFDSIYAHPAENPWGRQAND